MAEELRLRKSAPPKLNAKGAGAQEAQAEQKSRPSWPGLGTMRELLPLPPVHVEERAGAGLPRV
eukprot:2501618-Amphidinium_carterae.2